MRLTYHVYSDMIIKLIGKIRNFVNVIGVLLCLN